jgi:hypothetical protein
MRTVQGSPQVVTHSILSPSLPVTTHPHPAAAAPRQNKQRGHMRSSSKFEYTFCRLPFGSNAGETQWEIKERREGWWCMHFRMERWIMRSNGSRARAAASMGSGSACSMPIMRGPWNIQDARKVSPAGYLGVLLLGFIYPSASLLFILEDREDWIRFCSYRIFIIYFSWIWIRADIDRFWIRMQIYMLSSVDKYIFCKFWEGFKLLILCS